MKSRHALLALLGVIAALLIGWTLGERDPVTKQADQPIPDDLDYYLAGVNYRALNEEGQLDYRLKSPYLAHYRRNDISLVRKPRIEVLRTDNRWHVSAERAEIEHGEDRLNLRDQVNMRRAGDTALAIASEWLIFEPSADQVISPGRLRVDNAESTINAESAKFDLERQIYEFKGIKSRHEADNS